MKNADVMSVTLRLVFLSVVLGVSNTAQAQSPLASDCGAGPAGSDEAIETSNRPEKSIFDDYFTQAGCYLEQAAQAGALWLGSEELLARSASEAEAGNWGDAIRLAKETRFQAMTALQQAAHENEAWKKRVIRKEAADKR